MMYMAMNRLSIAIEEHMRKIRQNSSSLLRMQKYCKFHELVHAEVSVMEHLKPENK